MKCVPQFLARTVTGVFNSLKDVLPSFEGDEMEIGSELNDCKREDTNKAGFFHFNKRPDDYQVLLNFIPQPRSVVSRLHNLALS